MNKKILMTVGLIGILIPFNTKALTGSVNLSCTTTTLKPGESTNCTIKGNINEEVSAVSIKLGVGDSLTLSNVKTDASWQGDGEGGNIELYTDSNKKGEFPIATFTVKADSLKEGANTNITLSNVNLSDKDFTETTFNVNPLNIRIPSTINTLSALTIDGTSVSEFSADKTTYNLSVASNKTSINIAATATDSYSKVTGDTGAKALKYGSNTFNVKVTSEMGVEKNYNITIIRPEVRELKSLSINDEVITLNKGVYEYNYTVKNEITSVDLKAELNNTDEATFVDEFGVRKIEELKEGNNEILVKVKDSNNEELTYKIIVNRLNAEGKDVTVEKNPSTWSGVGYGIFALVTVIGGAVFFLVRKRSKFPKKA